MVERSGMTNPVEVGSPLSLRDLEDVAVRRRKVVLADAARSKVAASRAAVEAVARAGDDAPRVYGINTGFGALSETRIGASDVRDLQRNLVRSHSTGVGPNLSIPEVRGMMLLRAQVVALGHSGVRPLVVDLLLGMLNAGVHPRIPAQGSVGASGDLAPLAHLALTAIGEGEASVDDGKTYIASSEALAHAGLTPVVARGEGGPRAHQRHPVHGVARRARGPRRRAIVRPRRRRRSHEPRGAQGLEQPVRSAPAGRASASGAGQGRRQPAQAPRRQRHRREPPRLRQGAGRLLAPLHAAGARRLARRARLRRARSSRSRSTASPTTPACSSATASTPRTRPPP